MWKFTIYFRQYVHHYFTLRRTGSILLERGRARSHPPYRQGPLSESLLQNHPGHALGQSGGMPRHARRRSGNQVGARLRLLARDGRRIGMERHRSGRDRDEHRRPAVRRRDRKRTAVVDDRAQQAPDPRRGRLGRHQRHGRVPSEDARSGFRDTLDGRRDGRRGRFGAHDHRRQHRHGPIAPKRRDR